MKQFIPRGSHVRNSDCMYLLVLYTGPETKLILNQGNYRFKQSHVDKMINVLLIYNAAMMLLVVFMLTLLSYQFTENNIDRHPYVFQNSDPP